MACLPANQKQAPDPRAVNVRVEREEMIGREQENPTLLVDISKNTDHQQSALLQQCVAHTCRIPTVQGVILLYFFQFTFAFYHEMNETIPECLTC
jgi:hypothetical protein